MGQEWTPIQYDKKYSEWRDIMINRLTHYAPMWKIITDSLEDGDSVVDFGCGCGLFAFHAIQMGVDYSYGVDFSPVGIKTAKWMNPSHKDSFIVGNLYHSWPYYYRPYTTAMFLDVLEHLEEDRGCIQKVPIERKLILALPTFQSPDHVRVFKDEESCRRYEEFMRIDKIEKWKNIWIVYGKRE